jgi:tetratricopeptide (TPR) repeat protein
MHDYDMTPERLARARAAVDRALALEPESPDAHLALGLYHQLADRDLERALEEYTFVAMRRPNDSVVASRIGSVRAGQGRFDEAMAQFERAFELDPRNAFHPLVLGEMHRFVARYPEAERYFDLAIALAPDEPAAYDAKLGSYMEEGRLDRARATAESMPEVEEFFHHMWLVDLERRERNYQAALDRLAAVRTEAMPVALGLGWKQVAEGDLHRLMKRPERARASYKAAVAILEDAVTERPDDIVPHVWLAKGLAGLGRKAEAIREVGRVVEMSPISRDPWGGTAWVVLVAETYTTVGEHEAALDLLESLTSIPSWMSYGLLRFEPAFDPLRDNPRFQKLLADKKKQLPPR